jgi:hypothetical protein
MIEDGARGKYIREKADLDMNPMSGIVSDGIGAGADTKSLGCGIKRFFTNRDLNTKVTIHKGPAIEDTENCE